MDKYENKKYMEHLKSKYNAWLVIDISETQDNGEYVQEYLIFNGDGVFECYLDEKLKPPTYLPYHKSKLNKIADMLDDERQNKLLNILKDVKDMKR